MKANRIWQGVRLRQVDAAADPESPRRAVQIPASWEDAAAGALCLLAPGEGRVALPALAQSWMLRLAPRAREAGAADLPDRLHDLLLRRRAAPTPDIWQGAPGETPGFVLNLPAFHDPAAGFDAAGFAAAAATAAEALALLAPAARSYAIGFSDLAGLLAALGVPYGSPAARDIACCLAAILRGRTEAAIAGPQLDLLATAPSWPAPPAACAVPGLAAEAARAREAARGGCAKHATAILPPGPADALLGVETGGIAPAFAPAGPEGLSRAARAWLAAVGLSAEAALAAALAGEAVIPAGTQADHLAMHDALAPYFSAMPPRPVPLPAPASGVRREELPARRRGFTQKAAVGGHRVFLRTGEYADGRLGEVGLALPRESATVRGLGEALAAAISAGLQHGTPLEAYVDALAHLRFAPAGAVEGDPAIEQASSIPDYVVRSLAAAYLGRIIPAAHTQDEPAEEPPSLPMHLPRSRRRPALRVVAA